MARRRCCRKRIANHSAVARARDELGVRIDVRAYGRVRIAHGRGRMVGDVKRLRPADASTEGARLLRTLRTRFSYARLARLIAVDESTVRHWAHERRTPAPDDEREAVEKYFGIPAEAWFSPPREGAAARAGETHAAQVACRAKAQQDGQIRRGSSGTVPTAARAVDTYDEDAPTQPATPCST